MAEKLSNKLWCILNHASETGALGTAMLCDIDEAMHIVKAWEDAPEGTGVAFDRAGSWLIDKADKERVYAPIRGKRVKIVEVK